MAWSEDKLQRRARRAYEFGRVKFAAKRAWIPLPLLLAADCVACRPAVTIGVGVALVCTTMFLAWRGGIFQRAIWPATIAGASTFAAATCASFFGLTGELLLAACLLGGVFAGAGLALWSRREGVRPLGVFTIGAAHALLVGALGCTSLGIGALVGLGAGLIATAPLLFIPVFRRE